MLLSNRKNFGGNLFSDFFNDPFFSGSLDNRSSLMRTDIQDIGDHYLLDIELPGFKKEEVRAELKNGYLNISAETSSTEEEKDEKNNYIRKERYCGSMRRSFYVGTDITQDDIKASFENGVLKLRVPKEAPKQLEENRYISIE